MKISLPLEVEHHPEVLRGYAAILKAFRQNDLILGDMEGDLVTAMHCLRDVYLNNDLAGGAHA